MKEIIKRASRGEPCVSEDDADVGDNHKMVEESVGSERWGGEGQVDRTGLDVSAVVERHGVVRGGRDEGARGSSA